LEYAFKAEDGEDLRKSLLLFKLIRFVLRGQHQFVVEDKLVHDVDIVRFCVDVLNFIENQVVHL
jgi:hypothetical protein